MRKTVSAVMLTLLVTSMLATVLRIQPVKGATAQYFTINPDGSISPPQSLINTLDNVTYTIVEDFNVGITVQRSNIVIDGNGHTLYNFYSLDYGLNLTNVENVTIRNATIMGFNPAVYFDNSSDDTLSNIITEGPYPSFEPNIIIGFLLTNTNDTQIENNKIVDSSWYGISLTSCFGNNVSGNSGTSYTFGIALYNSSNNILSNNHFEGGATEGIDGVFLCFSNNNTLSRNFMSGYAQIAYAIDDSTTGGIELLSSDYNTLIGNDVTGNGEGISLKSSDSNILIANNVTRNVGYAGGGEINPPWGFGIRIDSSSNNTIYHNNFVDNFYFDMGPYIGIVANNVMSDGSPNVWDDGYPSGGNFWSDYTGTDLYSGQYQNVSGSDGIGDTPYVIDANNTDRYPMMNLYSLTSFYVAKTVIGRGFSTYLYFAVANYGNNSETINVTVYANTTSIASENVTLASGKSSTIRFLWNTTGFAYGNYALTVANETSIGNDNFTGGNVIVTIPGDLDGDLTVSRQDLLLLSNAYGLKPDDSNWNPNADINGDGKVNLLDLVILALHYGQHYP